MCYIRLVCYAQSNWAQRARISMVGGAITKSWRHPHRDPGSGLSTKLSRGLSRYVLSRLVVDIVVVSSVSVHVYSYMSVADLSGGLGGTCPPSTDVNNIHLHCCWLHQPLCKLFVTTVFYYQLTKQHKGCKLVKVSTLQPEMQQIWHLMNINKPKFSQCPLLFCFLNPPLHVAMSG